MSDLLGDLRFALRSFRRSPGFTSSTLLVLAVGIGAVTLMFSTLNSTVLQPLPFPEPERLVWAWEANEHRDMNSVSALDYRDYRDRVDAFESLGAYHVFSVPMVVTGFDEAERVPTTRVTANFFPTLGVMPRLGRNFTADEEVLGVAEVVILSDGYWRRKFGEDPNVIGQGITLDGRPHEIVGVMPRGFQYPAGAEVWLPMKWDEGYAQGRGNRNFFVVGRIVAGGSIAEAQAQVDVVARQLQEEYPENNATWYMWLQSLHERHFGGIRSTLLILMGIVTLVPLVACANVAALSLARATTRNPELATRLALGASRGRVMRQLLTESVVLAAVGGGLGVALAALGARLLRAVGPASLPRLEDVGIDLTVLAFALGASLIAVPIFGVGPALRGTRFGLIGALRTGGVRGGSEGRAGFRGALVVSQVALSLMLMVAAGLLWRSFTRLERVDPGFQTEHLMSVQLQLPQFKYATEEERALAWDELARRLLAVPGVTDVGATDQPPVRGGMPWNYIYRADQPPTRHEEQTPGSRKFVTEGYFSTLGIPLVAGRSFNETDRAGSPLVMMLTETAARSVFGDDNPIGLGVALWGETFQVVGVVPDVREFGLGAEFRPVFFISARQFPRNALTFLVRAGGDPLSVAGSLRSAVLEWDRDIPITGFRTMAGVISASLALPRFRALLVGAFALMAVLLAAFGLYGVIAYIVTQRNREIGIRMAVGADAGAITTLVLKQGMGLAATGIAIGVVGGLLGTRVMRSLLFDVTTYDPVTFGGVTVLLVLVAVLACLVPAWRAVRVDPLRVLRSE